MRLQVLSSGSKGNATLVRAGEACLLVDAGLGPRNLRDRLEVAQLGPRALDHVLVTHGHLDHSRSAGAVAKRHDATVHCAPSLLEHRAVIRAPRVASLPVGGSAQLDARGEAVTVTTARLPHDCDPTVGVALDHDGRRAVVLTDLGLPDREVARTLAGAHVLVLEFNYDPGMLDAGPYPERLKDRIRGGRGHLSTSRERSARAPRWPPAAHRDPRPPLRAQQRARPRPRRRAWCLDRARTGGRGAARRPSGRPPRPDRRLMPAPDLQLPEHAAIVLDQMERHATVRRFASASLAEGLLERLVEAASQAATSSWIQGYVALRVTDAEERHALAELAAGRHRCARRPSSSSSARTAGATASRHGQRTGRDEPRGVPAVRLDRRSSRRTSPWRGGLRAGDCMMGACATAGVAELLELPEGLALFGLCLGERGTPLTAPASTWPPSSWRAAIRATTSPGTCGSTTRTPSAGTPRPGDPAAPGAAVSSAFGNLQRDTCATYEGRAHAWSAPAREVVGRRSRAGSGARSPGRGRPSVIFLPSSWPRFS